MGHWARVQRRFTQAGGCFLALAILAGTLVGIALGEPMKGVLIGTGVGIAATILLWIVDRRS